MKSKILKYLQTNMLFLSILIALPITINGAKGGVSSKVVGESFYDKLALAAIERTKHNITYDGRYFSIKYPGGDIPSNLGVCTDVIIRSYRALGIDLQKLVHEDIKKNPDAYPRNWTKAGQKVSPDKNIDHRRVPNLMKFFERHGKVKSKTDKSSYQNGDIVTWNLKTNGFLPHIGIVVKNEITGGKAMVVHNIGGGPSLYDDLFDYEIIGHYSYGGQ